MQPRRPSGRSRRAACVATVAALSAMAVTVPSAGAQGAPALPPPVDAQVVGVVVDADGSPVGGAPMVVQATDTGSEFGELLFFPFFVAFTMGFGLVTCITGDDICPFTDDEAGIVERIGTDGGGAYVGNLPGAYVAGTETDTDWVVAAELPAVEGQQAGPTSSFEFEVNIAVQEAPPLPLWTEAPQVSVDGWSVSVSAPGAPDGLDGTDVQLVSPIARLETSGSSGRFDARLLEAAAGATEGLYVMATGSRDVRVPHANGRTIYHQRIRSAAVSVPLTPVAPSRGSGCSAVRRDGQAAVATGAAGCVLTDGDFATPLVPPPAPDHSFPPGVPDLPDPSDPSAQPTPTTLDPAQVTAATVELAQPIDLGLVVLHGVADMGTVEASADGITWEQLALTPAPGIAGLAAVTAVPREQVAARYVRATGSGAGGLLELSVWERTSDEAGSGSGSVAGSDSEAADPSSPAFGGDEANGSDDDDGTPVALRVLAAVVAALLLVAVGFGLGQARRSSAR